MIDSSPRSSYFLSLKLVILATVIGEEREQSLCPLGSGLGFNAYVVHLGITFGWGRFLISPKID